MDLIRSTINQAPLFHGLPEQYLDQIQRITSEKHVGKGEIVFCEGDEGNGFYMIISGKVKVCKRSADGKEKILHILEPGEPFGEIAVFSGREFPANAESITQTHLLFFPRRQFELLISQNPSLALNLLSILSMRLKQFTAQIEGLSLKEVPGRLAGYLLGLSSEQSYADTVQLTITKGHLAGLLGTIPETLSRMLTRMYLNGLIMVEGRDISLLDRNGLQALAESGRFSEE